MYKKYWAKVVFVALFVILAGIFYSCKMSQKDEVEISLDTQEVIGLENSVKQSVEQSSVELSNDTTDEDIDITEDINSTEVEFDKRQISKSEDNNKTVSNDLSGLDDEIYVYICGEVNNPDVYKVAKTTRVFELIAAAGGLTDAAAEDYINQASTVLDGQQIYIPSTDEVKDILLFEISNVSNNETPKNSDEVSAQLVNINTATDSQLMTLSGIGQAKAQAIIEYRNSKGGFKTIEEIKQIDGIKEAVYEKIKDKIRVD